jgi:exonuclease III
VNNNLHVLNFNVQGVQNATKYTLFTQIITQIDKTPDVIFLTEHWLDKHQVDCFHIDNYKLIAAYGRSKMARGGSLILLRNTLKCKVTKMRIKSIENLFEICGAKIEFNNRKVVLISLYRPSNSMANSKFNAFFENLESFLEKHRGADEIIIAGDLNINLLASDTNARKLTEIMNAYNLFLVNNVGVTRAADNIQGGTLIDHIFSNITQNNTFQIINNILSDHKAVTASINLPTQRIKDTFQMTRSFCDKNWETFINYLNQENWLDVYAHPDIDNKSEIFMEKLIKYFEKSFPLKKRVKRANQINKIKLTTSTQQLKNELILLNDEIITERDVVKRDLLRQQRSTLKKYVAYCVNGEIKKYNDTKINEACNKSSAAWKIVRESTGQNRITNGISQLNINGREEVIKLNIANVLNHSFLVAPPNVTEETEYDFEVLPNKFPFRLRETCEAEVYSVIDNLAPKKSFGWDCISAHTLKQISLQIVEPMSHLVNTSFTVGRFPRNMKLNKVIPTFKKGDKEDLNNWRPIAMTSSVSKIYEKIFLNRLENHLQVNNYVSPQQHGFQKGKSTLTALYDFVETVYNSLEAREKLNVILYDFSNAFGTLYPPLLLRKLKIYGLCDKALSWLQSFLTQREQYVQLRDLDCDNTEININSDRLVSDMGVPQGTILGPTGFSAYLNDISLKVLIAMLILFADDSTAIVKGKTYEIVNKKTVATNNEFVKFANENHLTVNATKTKVIQMRTHQTRNVIPPEMLINNCNVDIASGSRLLGVEICETMNWSAQCEKVANKLRSVTYMFTMLREKVTENILKQVYFAYAQSHILYSIVIWGASPHVEGVFIAQKRVVRAMAGLRYTRSNCALESCRPLFKRYGIMTVYSLYILECMKFLKKNPEKFKKRIEVPEAQGPRTRAQVLNSCPDDLYVNTCSLNITSQNPACMIPRIFNALPIGIKCMQRDNEFICKIRELTLKHQFYDLNEFFVCEFDSD